MAKAVKAQVAKIETQVATKEVGIKTLLKESVGTVVTLSKEDVTAKLKTLVKSKSKRLAELVALETLDKKQLEELKEIRAEFRENRYALQNVESHNVSALALARKNNGAMIGELKLIIEPSETKADDKIKLEEQRIADAKAEEERLEQERLDAIELKIKEAGEFFDAELELARTTNDWTAFDKYYTEFEEGLETLDAFEFEGTELLEKYKLRKENIVELIETAKNQEAQAGELKSKEEELAKEKAKMEEDKRRMFEMFGIGFTFNGLEFTKEGEAYEEDVINGKTLEEFTEFVKGYTDRAEELKTFNALLEEAKGLELDVTAYTGVETKEALNTAVVNAKAEAQKKGEEQTKKEKEEKAQALKDAGKPVCEAVKVQLAIMTAIVNPSEIQNEEAKGYVTAFFETIEKEFTLLQSFLNQDEPKEE